MSAATLPEVRAALASAFRTLGGARVEPVWPEPFDVPPAGVVIAIDLGSPAQVETDLAGQDVAYRLNVGVVASLAGGLARAQQTLDPYVDANGPRSVRRAVLRDTTLGGRVQYVIWHGYVVDPTTIEINAEQQYGAVAELEVMP